MVVWCEKASVLAGVWRGSSVGKKLSKGPIPGKGRTTNVDFQVSLSFSLLFVP